MRMGKILYSNKFLVPIVVYSLARWLVCLFVCLFNSSERYNVTRGEEKKLDWYA